MGLLSLFGFGGAMSPRAISQASKLACNPFAQPEVRMRELQRLLKQSTPESIAGAVRRFTANAQGHIADEEEKSWLMDALVEVGDRAAQPLEAYIRREQKLTYSLIAYQRIVGDDAARALYCQVLQDIGPKDHQKIEPKEQLVTALLPAMQEPAVQRALAPFLSDHSDDVVYRVLDGVQQLMDADTTRLEPPIVQGLTTLLTHPLTSARISRRVAGLLVRYGAPLGNLTGSLPEHLAEAFFVDGKGIVHARASA